MASAECPAGREKWELTFGSLIRRVNEFFGSPHEPARPAVCRHDDKGYFTTYYYDYKKVAEWETFYGFGKKEYTELFFSLCRISSETFERYLSLSEADRFSLTHEFASLIQFR